MIKIEFKENHENYAHDDSIIEFPSLGKKLVGDTYWFRVGIDSSIPYEGVVQFIASTFQKDLNSIKNLYSKRSYFWFFHFFDEGDEGVIITNIDNVNLKLNFVYKFRNRNQEYIIEEEEYFLNREAFLIEMEKEIKKYLV